MYNFCKIILNYSRPNHCKHQQHFFPEALSPEEKARLEELAKAEEAKAAERQRIKEEKKKAAEEAKK